RRQLEPALRCHVGRDDRLSARSTPFDGDDLDRFGDPLERNRSRAGRAEARTRDRLLARQDLTAGGERRDAGGFVHALADEVVSHLRRIRRVDSDAYLGGEAVTLAVLVERTLDRDGAGEC